MKHLQKIQWAHAWYAKAPSWLLVSASVLAMTNCKASMDTRVVNASGVKSARIIGNQTLYVADPSLLPRCASPNDGQLAYVRSLDSFQTGTVGLWVEVTIKGPKGDTATIGKDGRDAPDLLAHTWLVTQTDQSRYVTG